MSLYQKVLDDMKAAMLSKDQDKTIVLRAIKASILKKEISIRQGGTATLTDADILDVLTKEAKQRKDSITQFEAANRMDLADKEKYELGIIEDYLPKQLSEEEIEVIVDEVIAATGAKAPSDMGKVMGMLMPKVKGKADGGLVNKVVKAKLG
ncbi:GatB/YqeY domain-containing protein [bacterium]|nr:MAG: GatB/YqeY domain-containing protein [bacterium]